MGSIEGEGERIEYDGRADNVKFIRQAVMRRYVAGKLADESHGELIRYENTTDVFTVDGGTANRTAFNPTGRVRAMLTPVPKEGPPAPTPAPDRNASSNSNTKGNKYTISAAMIRHCSFRPILTCSPGSNVRVVGTKKRCCLGVRVFATMPVPQSSLTLQALQLATGVLVNQTPLPSHAATVAISSTISAPLRPVDARSLY